MDKFECKYNSCQNEFQGLDATGEPRCSEHSRDAMLSQFRLHILAEQLYGVLYGPI